MGYYTRFTVDYTPRRLSEDQAIQKRLDTIYGGYNPFDDEAKWYEWKEDMTKLSAEFPDVLFTLNGEGEEAGDIWVAYFKGGKVQVEEAQVILGEYDERKLR